MFLKCFVTNTFCDFDTTVFWRLIKCQCSLRKQVLLCQSQGNDFKMKKFKKNSFNLRLESKERILLIAGDLSPIFFHSFLKAKNVDERISHYHQQHVLQERITPVCFFWTKHRRNEVDLFRMSMFYTMLSTYTGVWLT